VTRSETENKRWWCTSAIEEWLDSLPDEAEYPLPQGKPLKLVISGLPPRTAKNSPQLFSNVSEAFLRDFILAWEKQRPPRPNTSVAELIEWIRNEEVQLPRPTMLPSENYRDWHHAAAKVVLPILRKLRQYLPIPYAVHVMVRVYRDADRGDWCGYAQGIGDFLEHVGVIVNDQQIQSWDGTRLHKDTDNPRVEIFVSPFTREGSTGLFERPAKEWAEHEEPEPVDCVEAEERMKRLTEESRLMLEERERRTSGVGYSDADDRLRSTEAAGSRTQLFSMYGGKR